MTFETSLIAYHQVGIDYAVFPVCVATISSHSQLKYYVLIRDDAQDVNEEFKEINGC